MSYLSDKFIEGRDDVVEDWAQQEEKASISNKPEYYAHNVQEESKIQQQEDQTQT